MSAFDDLMPTANATVFSLYGDAATYTPPTPPGGASVAVTAVLSTQDDERFDVASLRAVSAEIEVLVQVDELAAPAKGGKVRFDAGPHSGTEMEIGGEPERDGSVWRLTMRGG